MLKKRETGSPQVSSPDPLVEINARLRTAQIGVAIQCLGKRLYLQATLPPKLGSKKNHAHQQRITLGIYANPAGYKRAEAEARKIGGELAMNQFCWEDWQAYQI